MPFLEIHVGADSSLFPEISTFLLPITTDPLVYRAFIQAVDVKTEREKLSFPLNGTASRKNSRPSVTELPVLVL